MPMDKKVETADQSVQNSIKISGMETATAHIADEMFGESVNAT